MKWSTLAVSFIVSLVLASSGAQAQAQDGDADERARLHFQSATAYFDAGDYESALREFQSSYDLSGRPALLYNLYLAHERLGHVGAAMDHLERYLASDAEIERRPLLEERLANLQRRTAEARRPEGETAPGAEATPLSDGGLNVPAVVAFAVGGVGAVLWGVFGVLALTEDSDLADRCMAGCNEDDVSSLRTYNLVADIGFGTTLVGGATGLLLWLLLPTEDALTEGEAATLRIAPWAAESGAGLTVGGQL